MRHFDEIYEIAVARKGIAAIEASLPKPKSAAELAATPDDRWLSAASKAIFNSGFNWKVVDNKWPGIEAAFWQFDLGRNRLMSDEDFDALLANTDIIRHPTKIRAVAANAAFFTQFGTPTGGVGARIAAWPSDNYIGLLAMLKSEGVRLGGNTGMYFLRYMGVDSFVLSRDVTARLIAEGVIDKEPSSKSAMTSVQQAFNTWSKQSGRGLSAISRILAQSVGD